jgi:hypothetical protein
VFWTGFYTFLTAISFEAFLTGATLAGFYYSSSDDDSTTGLTFFLVWVLATGLAYYSLDDYSLSWTFFFGATGFWRGDLAMGDLATGVFLVAGFFGASSSDSSDDDYSTIFFFWATGFCSGDLAVWIGDFAGFWSGDLATFLAGFTSSSLSSSDDDSTFLAGLVVVLTGTTTFLAALTVFYYSELSSLDYCWTFFFGTTAFWTGDLALTTFFGASSSSLDYEEDSCFLAFLAAPFSVLTALIGCFWTLGVSSSIEAFEAFVGAWVALGLVTGVSSSSLDDWGWGFFLVYFLALTCSFLETIKGSGLDESSSESWVRKESYFNDLLLCCFGFWHDCWINYNSNFNLRLEYNNHFLLFINKPNINFYFT